MNVQIRHDIERLELIVTYILYCILVHSCGPRELELKNAHERLLKLEQQLGNFGVVGVARDSKLASSASSTRRGQQMFKIV